MKDALATAMTSLPEHLRRSLTWDRGKELSAHAALTVETGLPVCFADPHSPGQRGTNENTDGMLRQYLPKGIDLSRWESEDIAAVAGAVNSRPAGSSEWRPPRWCTTRSWSGPGRSRVGRPPRDLLEHLSQNLGTTTTR